ncbi:MAG: hypothetical protein LBL58_16310, partial [Tannerellaceae bacterium]|nr:hypothetical protein [Tannerellaceae bacterium]
MKKKGNLVKRLFIYVFSLCMLSLYTTGCVSYDEDIDDIYNRLEELQSQIDAIKKQIEDGHYVVSVTPLSNGIKITFNKGEPVEIVNGEKGAQGEKGTQWAIGDDGIWYKDGIRTNPPLRAIGQDGKQGETAPSPKMYKESNGKYYWIVYEWDDARNDFVPDSLNDEAKGDEPLYNYNTYVVDKGTKYELNVWVQDLTTPSNSRYEIIDLPKTPNSSDPFFLEFLGFERIKTPTRPISLEKIESEIIFFYWYLDLIYNIADGSYPSIWEGQKTVRKHQVLTTLKKDSAAAIVRTNLSKLELTLKDSQGGLLPISFGNPVRHIGELTKASGNDSIYILQMNGVQDTFPSVEAYKSKFKMVDNLRAVYSLIDTVSGINSGYKASIDPREGDYDLVPAILSSIGGQNKTSDDDYQVSIGDTLG